MGRKQKTAIPGNRHKHNAAIEKKRRQQLVNEVEVLLHKATFHHQRGEYPPAMQFYRQVLVKQPMNASALNNMGLIRKALGEPRVAEELIRIAVNLRPENAEFHYNLANAIREDNRFPAAIQEYKRALQINPNHFKALLNLGDSLRIMGEYEAADDAFNRAMQLNPEDSYVKLNKANLHLEMGDGDKAAEMYQELIKDKPGDAKLYSNCGAAYKQVGKMKEAAECFRKAVDIDPNMLGAIYSAVGLEKVKPDDPWFELLNKLKQNPRLALHEKTGLCFTLGKMYHDIGEYDAAFMNYSEGNSLRDQMSARLNRRFNARQHQNATDQIIKAYSPERLKNIRKVGALGDDEYTPIIIVGMPRSGTTLTEQIIASHPMCNGAGELPDIIDLAHKIDERENSEETLPFPQNIELLDEARSIELASRYLARLRELCGNSPRVTDKMPGNFNYLGFIVHLFPAAKIIDCRRDPIDNCLSCFMQNFSRRHEYSNDLKHLAIAYKEYEKLMDYWYKNLPVPVYRSQYEDLVENHEESARKLLEFCELEWDDAVLEFYKTKRNIQTASVVQVRQPLYTSAIKRWKKYEKHLKPLIEGLGLQEREDAAAAG